MTEVTRFSDLDLTGIDNFQDALALVGQRFGSVRNVADVLGDGFGIADDKAALVGVPLLLLDWHRNSGKGDQDYVSIRAMAQTDNGPEKVVINDGGSGIRAQIDQLENDGIMGGVLVPKGLRESRFRFDKRTGKADKNGDGEAVTYYLNISA